MGDDIENLKSVFRSLVVSSPTQVDVRSLLRDYRQMVGAQVPIGKHGYRDPVQFLKEKFSDCFLFGGQPGNPVLTLIVPNTLKHIDRFVKSQKISSSNKFNPKRRSVSEDLIKPPSINLVSETFNRRKNQDFSNTPLSIQEINKPHNKGSSTLATDNSQANMVASKASKYLRNTDMNSNMQNRDTDHNLPHNYYVLEEKRSSNSETDNVPSDILYNTNAVKNFLKKRLPLYDNSQDLNEEQSSEKNCQLLQDDDSGRHSSSSSHSAKIEWLEQLKLDILELITEAQDGVWCTDLMRLYRAKHGRELNFSRFGYTSIISLVYSLESALQITRPQPTGDWLLQHRARAARAPPALQPARRARPPRPARPAPRPACQPLHHPDSDEALPGIDFDPEVFPEDCMHFMETIESISLDDFRPGAMIEVMIGEVYSPSHFWFIRLGDNYNIAMEDMMDEMTHYYNNEGRNRALARGAVRVGHYCSALYERDWHRAVIVKIIDSDTVKVRHVDYGTVDTVRADALRALRRRWARLPAQAARALLGGVRPPGAGARWPHAAAAAFLRLVTDRRLVANVVALDARAACAELLLIDTAGADDVCLSRELVRAGHADPRPDSALRALDVYLYPRFEAIESGDTPNYTEIHSYLRDGITLDYVEAYRAHVPPVLPSPTHLVLARDRLSPAAPPAPPAPPASHSNNDKHPDTATSSLESENLDDTVESPITSELSTKIPLHLPNSNVSTKCALSLSQPEPKLDAARVSSTAQSGPWMSCLSPHAVPYVPGAAHLGQSRHAHRPRAPCGPAFPPPLPPPPPPPPGVTLTLEDCETYRALSHVNPTAAHWFIVGAMGRARIAPVFPFPTQSPMHPSFRIRPPPGFGI